MLLLLIKTKNFLKQFSTLTKSSSPSSSSSLNWRNQIKQNQLTSQISSILLQRHNWVPLIQNLKLSSKQTQLLLPQVLLKTKQNPEISLSFFNWARSYLGFEPGLLSHCIVIHISLQSDISLLTIKPLFNSIIETHSPPEIVDSLIQVGRAQDDSQSNALSFLMECYSKNGSFMDALKVFVKMQAQDFIPSVRACNSILDALMKQNEIRLAWCFYAVMIRNGVVFDKLTWSLIAQILCKDEKFERIIRVLDSGISSAVMCNLLVDCYSKIRDFEAAFEWLNRMSERKLNPGFSSYSSILDGACRYGDLMVIDRVESIMEEKRLIWKKSPSFEYDLVIRKLCKLEKIYAGIMFYKRACDKNIRLEHATYNLMLEKLSEEGRPDEAISIYRTISEKGLKMNYSCYDAFVKVLCQEVENEESFELLESVIREGFSSPCSLELSRFISIQCSKGRWRETENLLDLIFEKGIMLDSSCFCPLVKYYCSRRQIDLALELHNKTKNLNICLDEMSYDLLLKGMFSWRRTKKAVEIFDYMRRKNIVSNSSFGIMIRGLCGEKEFRKAMEIHDEMLKMGLKPDKATYKRLISRFKPDYGLISGSK